jgi:GTPase SAR1 family protein
MEQPQFHYESTIKELLSCAREAAEVLERSRLSPRSSSQFRKSIELIRQRCEDRHMYLAVIGEFNSGKSTFINALLRDNLMKTGPIETTATAVRFYYGELLEVVVKANGSGDVRIGENNFRESSRQLAFPAVETADLREFINHVTSVAGSPGGIESLSVYHPSAFLRDGVVVIDTPGVSTQIAGHEEVTQQILKEEADAAILLIPALQAGTRAQFEFAEENIRSFLHRCIFLITKIEHVPERDRKELLRRIVVRLKERLGVDESAVLVAPPLEVLLDRSGEEILSSEERHRRRSFALLENRIIKRMQKEKTLSIAERIVRLLTDLLEKLLSHLRKRQQELQASEDEIHAAILPSLQTFANKHLKQAEERVGMAIDAGKTSLETVLSDYRQEIMGRVRRAIYSCQSSWELRDVGERINSILESRQRELSKETMAVMRTVQDAAAEEGRKFNTAFWKEYQRLDRLRKESLELKSPPMLAFDSILLFDDFYYGSSEGTMYLMLSLLAEIFGSLSLSSFFLEGRKEKAWNKVRPQIQSDSHAVSTRTQQSFQEYCDQLKDMLNSHIKYHIDKYKSAVDMINAEQRKKRQGFEIERQRIDTDCLRISKRLRRLEKLQHELAAL